MGEQVLIYIPTFVPEFKKWQNPKSPVSCGGRGRWVLTYFSIFFAEFKNDKSQLLSKGFFCFFVYFWFSNAWEPSLDSIRGRFVLSNEAHSFGSQSVITVMEQFVLKLPVLLRTSSLVVLLPNSKVHLDMRLLGLVWKVAWKLTISRIKCRLMSECGLVHLSSLSQFCSDVFSYQDIEDATRYYSILLNGIIFTHSK